MNYVLFCVFVVTLYSQVYGQGVIDYWSCENGDLVVEVDGKLQCVRTYIPLKLVCKAGEAVMLVGDQPQCVLDPYHPPTTPDDDNYYSTDSSRDDHDNAIA